MRILNIGATGRVGRLTTERARRAGHEVTAFGRSASELPKAAGVFPFAGDVTEAAGVDEADPVHVRAHERLDGVTAKTIPRPNVARFPVDRLRDDASVGRTYLITL